VLERHEQLFDEPEFQNTPQPYHRLNDIAFSGDGEPTSVAVFPKAARLAADLRREFKLSDVKIVVITNASLLDRPAIAETLALLDHNSGEIWAKLDAGTEAYFRTVNRCRFSLDHITSNILGAARARPIVIQSLFMRLHGEPPPSDEIDGYVERLRGILEHGGRIGRIQVYTIARRPAESFVTPLTPPELQRIAKAIEPLGVAVEWHG
jgi:wyosine [tRNA(Phe)-imidazoG37] synthetase (radical SAM superfamily)